MNTFTTKKIANRLTLGERLRKARLGFDLSLAQAEFLTKIKQKYLEALETNDFNSLPSPTYSKCFIRTYGRVLSLPVSELLSQYRQEGEFASSKFSADFSPKPDLAKPVFMLTPGKIASLVVGIIIMVFGSYLWYQVSGFTAAPKITLTNPQNSKTSTSAPSITLEGRTDSEAKLLLNQQNLGIDTKGKFKEEVQLREGVNILELVAENQLGKKTKKIITVIAHLPNLQSAILGESPENGLHLTVEAGPNSSWVTIYADEKKIFRGVILAKAKQEFYAVNTFSLSTTNAGSLQVFLNGKALGLLGVEGQTKTLKLDKNSLNPPAPSL